MDRPGVRQVPEGSGEQGKMEKTGCKITCGAPATLAVKELMMMMMSSLSVRLSPPFSLISHSLFISVSGSVFCPVCFYLSFSVFLDTPPPRRCRFDIDAATAYPAETTKGPDSL